MTCWMRLLPHPQQPGSLGCRNHAWGVGRLQTRSIQIPALFLWISHCPSIFAGCKLSVSNDSHPAHHRAQVAAVALPARPAWWLPRRTARNKPTLVTMFREVSWAWTAYYCNHCELRMPSSHTSLCNPFPLVSYDLINSLIAYPPFLRFCTFLLRQWLLWLLKAKADG